MWKRSGGALRHPPAYRWRSYDQCRYMYADADAAAGPLISIAFSVVMVAGVGGVRSLELLG